MPTPMDRPRPAPVRRLLLAGGACAAMAAPALSSGCNGGFERVSKIDGLRVLAVVADKPYANPGDTVTFKMHYEDVNPIDKAAGPRKIQITWLAGCYDPAGDAYYGCYEQLGGLL